MVVHPVDQVLVPRDQRVRERPPHRAEQPGVELRGIDVGSVRENVSVISSRIDSVQRGSNASKAPSESSRSRRTTG
jgi:hypothetical protein